MKARIHGLLVAAIFVTAADSCRAGIVGYVTSRFDVGSNLFNNPLECSTPTEVNSLNALFPAPPQSTTVSLWNPTNLSFDVTSSFTNGSWSINLVLPPGSGALVTAPKAFTNTIVGTALDHSGNVVTGDPPSIPPPPVFTGPDGVYLLGDKAPFPNIGTDIFLNILGRLPNIGEQVTRLQGVSTYLGNGEWDSIPTLPLGQAAFLTIISEPPRLTILYTNGSVIVSWPAWLSGWVLQTNTDLATGSWRTYNGTVANNRVTNSTLTRTVFFRLSHK